jgi:sortase (surface protein transpeptidase)
MSPKKKSLPEVSQSKPEAQPKKPTHRTRNRAYVFFGVILAVALIGYGAYGLYTWWNKTHVQAPASENFDVSEPQEAAISTSDPAPFNYSPDQPKTIDIPAIGVSAYIQKVGLRKNNSIGVPSNIHLAGWFTQSVRPGDVGLSIIDGHVQGTYKPGIFADLGKLKKDDVIIITFGDNSQKSFAVMRVDTLPLQKASEALLAHDPKIKNQLNLVTCAGEYVEKLKSYDQRVVVVTKLVE